MSELAKFGVDKLPNENLAVDLLRLQQEQLLHDEGFHKEIIRLNAHDRIKHIALHISKYNCQLQINWGEQELRKRILTDSLIMAISGLTMLNSRISDLWEVPNSVYSPEEFSRILANKFECGDDGFLISYASASLPLMAGAEKLDHIEAYDFRASFVRSFSEVAAINYCRISLFENENPHVKVRQRLLSVKRKNIFYEG